MIIQELPSTSCQSICAAWSRLASRSGNPLATRPEGYQAKQKAIGREVTVFLPVVSSWIPRPGAECDVAVCPQMGNILRAHACLMNLVAVQVVAPKDN